eukprot:TRINITY_DN35782_c0_g1_i1.p1 TRINITY_DN35782_c0_g1~~TRINITY_DN35782_c0_g1_i1.p1  ORF type:complete len:529 (+),score=122.05 TRINITY_DN35782_c0_g1_i1:61-1587(+)
MAAGDELADLQEELASVKKTLQVGGTYLGLTGQPLQKYFNDLSDKEKIHLEMQMRTRSNVGSNGGYSTKEIAVARHVKGPRVARALPEGPVESFERLKLDSVLKHLCTYEASAQECAKALRALSTLAYDDAKSVMAEKGVIPQLLYLVELHPTSAAMQLQAMKTFCNLAFQPDVALGALTAPEVLTALYKACCQKIEGANEVCERAGEALARIIMYDVEAELAAAEAKTSTSTSGSAFSKVFKVSFSTAAEELKKNPWKSSEEGIHKIVGRLFEGELVEPKFVAERLVAVAPIFEADVEASLGWLAVLRQFLHPVSKDVSRFPALSEALLSNGAMSTAVNLMDRHAGDAQCQGVGMAVLFYLTTQNRRPGPEAFANANAGQRLQEAMNSCPKEEDVQLFGCRLLVIIMDQNLPVQKRAALDFNKTVVLCKEAMSHHIDNQDVQVAALSMLHRLLEALCCVDEVKEKGGEGLVKAVMTRHKDVVLVQSWGRSVLDALLLDRHWTPTSLR